MTGQAALLALSLFASLAPFPARALDDCFAQSAGDWRGPVRSDDRIESMVTHFDVTPDGALVGRYQIAADPPFDGTLTEFRPGQACSALFTWTDPYGKGVVRIHFTPETGRFVGRWGITEPVKSYIFDGYREAPRHTS